MEVQKWLDKGFEFATEYGIKVLGAIVIWIIGSWIIKKITKATGKVMAKKDYDESLQKFLVNLISWILKILLLYSSVEKRS